jgi:hypothetical protein
VQAELLQKWLSCFCLSHTLLVPGQACSQWNKPKQFAKLTVFRQLHFANEIALDLSLSERAFDMTDCTKFALENFSTKLSGCQTFFR